ncbi:putative transcriptional regulator [[Actinomadura] parvosata subsp. kistnae]|nr:putative transcriptional regulator [Actinomadura parvosata subsp. kistnae]
MPTLTFTAYEVTSIRFAFSPLREVSASIHALRTPAGRTLHLPWLGCPSRGTSM